MTFAEIYDLIARILTFPVTLSAGGGLQFSIVSLTVAILFLIVVLRVSKVAQRFIQRTLLERLPLDPGVSYTLQRLAHFIVMTVGALLALKIGFGVDLTSVAVIFTALSVGIGLGLKEISGDVASGFVLLFERPVRIGDRIRLSGDGLEGDVIEIGLRTTKVRTIDNMTVIVPNSRLANDTYVNWSYGGKAVKLRVGVGAAYGSNVDAVREALLVAATRVDGVAADPAPSVVFTDFGASSLDFELVVWVLEPHEHPSVRSDLRFAIAREFDASGIEIPFPQRDLHIKTAPERLWANHEAGIAHEKRAGL